MDTKTILENNRRWARGRIQTDPDFFTRLAAEQHPKMFWVGCSDSRVPANKVTALDAGEIFVHRNVANIASGSDMNFLSALQYAVDALKVEHIVVCGHYGCGGVKAALSDQSHGLLDHWLAPIRRVRDQNKTQLQDAQDQEEACDLLVEMNVRAQVASISNNPIVRAALDRGQQLEVHGWVYRLRDGHLLSLHCSHGGCDHHDHPRAIDTDALRLVGNF